MHLPISCSINMRELQFSSAMIFAVEEINNSSELLPGITLGYQIHDSCASVPVAVQVAFQLANGLQQLYDSNKVCSRSGRVTAVVGESGSTPSISMSRIFGPFDIPQVMFLTIQNIWIYQVPCVAFFSLNALCLIFSFRLATSLHVRVCLTRHNTQPFFEPSPVTSSRQRLLPNSLNNSVGLGSALSGLDQTMVTMGWRPFYEQRRKRVYVWNTLNPSFALIHKARFNKLLTLSAGSWI